MNNEEKTAYLRKAISIKLDDNTNINSFSTDDFVKHYKKFPERLFKYRTVTVFNIDALVNSYIFLSPAEKMDDQFECSTNIDLVGVYNSKDDTLTSTFVDELIEMIGDYPPSISKDQMRELAFSYLNKKAHCDEEIIKKYIVDNPNIKDDEKNEQTINAFLQIVTSVWKSDTVQKSLEDLFIGAANAKHEQGIGSLAESNTSQVMWEMYANHYKGYCVEYDLRLDPNCLINTFPVIYGDKRKTELIRILVALSIEALIYQMSRGKSDSFDRSLDYIRLFVTKFEEWSFQKEWRILGEKNFKFNVPKPKAIYIGKKCSNKDKRKLFDIAKRMKIKLYQQKDNMADLTIDFERIL